MVKSNLFSYSQANVWYVDDFEFTNATTNTGPLTAIGEKLSRRHGLTDFNRGAYLKSARATIFGLWSTNDINFTAE
jgi:hypothetical protein